MDQCSICLDDVAPSVPALACGHRFHAACLAQMASAVGTAARTSRRGTLTACPNCRTVSRVSIVAPVRIFLKTEDDRALITLRDPADRAVSAFNRKKNKTGRDYEKDLDKVILEGSYGPAPPQSFTPRRADFRVINKNQYP